MSNVGPKKVCAAGYACPDQMPTVKPSVRGYTSGQQYTGEGPSLESDSTAPSTAVKQIRTVEAVAVKYPHELCIIQVTWQLLQQQRSSSGRTGLENAEEPL